jgi:hypothetical protein
MPLQQYHPGQIQVQEEANSRTVADHLAGWTGPAAEFAAEADMIVLASEEAGGRLAIRVLAGAPPLVEVVGDARVRLTGAPAASVPEGRCGGLAINFGVARRVRLNGTVSYVRGAPEMQLTEAFTLCRKYVAPSVPRAGSVPARPASRSPAALDDPWVQGVLARAETSFLATISPEGWPDMAHRGGPAPFITLDPATGRLSWPEFVGDGVFKSAGNARATGRLTLLVPDLDTGDAVELAGRGDYVNERVLRRERREPLVQFKASYPVQGRMECTVEAAFKVERVLPPRRRLEKALKVTSASHPDEQAPQ